MQAPAGLIELQAWMMRAIVDLEDALPPDLDQIRPSQSQSAAQRLAIYRQGYLARLQECLRESFPVLLAAIGRDTFDAFAAEYVQQHPPNSYTLGHLADHFVEHLIATRPAAAPAGGWPDFLIGLAQLEYTIEQVFDGPGSEEMPPLDVGRFFQLANEQAHTLRLLPNPSLRLLSFSFPINDYYAAAKAGECPPWPDATATWLAIVRHDCLVRRIPLEEAEFHLLTDLIGGKGLEEALSVSSATTEQVAQWFAGWGRLRLFCGVQTENAL